MPNKRITELAAATVPLDGTEKVEIVQGGVNKQVDSSELGGGGTGGAIVTSWKEPAYCATTANITLSGDQTIDGINTAGGIRVLVKNQSAFAQNGIYSTSSGAWSRSTDADTADELEGAGIVVQDGTVNGNTTWIQTADGITLGVTGIEWTQIGTVAPNASETVNGISEEATLAEVIAGTGAGGTAARLFVNPAKLKDYRDLSETTATLGGSTLTCNCNSKVESRHVYATLTSNTSIVFSNKTNSQLHSLIVAITGSNIVLTFESDVRMARYNESGTVWNQSTKALTVSSIGTGDLHEFSLIKTGSIYILRYDGPVRA